MERYHGVLLLKVNSCSIVYNDPKVHEIHLICFESVNFNNLDSRGLVQEQ